MFCTSCGTSLGANAKFCYDCGQAAEASTASISRNLPSSSTSTTSTSSSISGQSRTPVSTVSFREYRERKEKERSSRFKPKAKKAKVETQCKEKTSSEVKINIGLRKLRDNDLKFVRGSTLPLTVSPTIGAEDLLKKATEKIVKFNSELTSGVFGFTLLYPDRTQVKTLPGSTELFTLEKYKEEIGKAYGRLTFHICKTEEYLDFLCEPLYCSDQHSDIDPEFQHRIEKVFIY